MADDKDIKVNVSADTSEFKRAMKEAASLPKKLQQSTFGTMGKVNKALNKDAKKQGKDALKQEKDLKDLMKSQLDILNNQAKARKKDLELIKATNAELRKTQSLYIATQKGRRGTGVMSARERMGAVGRGIGGLAGGLGRMGLGLLGGIGGLARGAAEAVGHAVTSDIRGGYGAYVGYGRAAGRLSGTGYNAMAFKKGSRDLTTLNKITGRNDSQDMYSLQGFGRSQALGFSSTETLGQMSGMAAATGGGRGLLRRTQMAQNVARQYGGDVGQVTGFMGSLTAAGGDKQGAAGKREFQRTMSHAMQSGMDRSRAGEAMSAMGAAIASAASVSGGKVNSGAVTGLMALLGRSGNPALQGMRGLGVMNGIDSAVKGFGQVGSSAEANKALFYQMRGFGSGAPGTDFFDITRQAQRGVHGNVDNLMAMMEGARGQGGGNSNARDLALSTMTNGAVSMDQATALYEAIDAGGGDMREKLAEIMKESLPVDQQIANSNLEIAKRTATLDDRMVEIGKSSAKAVEELQDLRNNLVDALMPLALKAFEAMVSLLKGIWESVDSLSIQMMEGGEARDQVKALMQQASDVENSNMSDADKAARLAELAEEMGTRSDALRNRHAGTRILNQFRNHGLDISGGVTGQVNLDRAMDMASAGADRARRISSYINDRGVSYERANGLATRDILRNDIRGMGGNFNPAENLGHRSMLNNYRELQMTAVMEQLGLSLSHVQRAQMRGSSEWQNFDVHDALDGSSEDTTAFRARISAIADTAGPTGSVN